MIETVFQANLDGSNPQPVVKDLLPLGGLGAMTADSGHVFWWSGSVYEANLDGTGQKIIATIRNGTRRSHSGSGRDVPVARDHPSELP